MRGRTEKFKLHKIQHAWCELRFHCRRITACHLNAHGGTLITGQALFSCRPWGSFMIPAGWESMSSHSVWMSRKVIVVTTGWYSYIQWICSSDMMYRYFLHFEKNHSVVPFQFCLPLIVYSKSLQGLSKVSLYNNVIRLCVNNVMQHPLCFLH